MRVLSWNVNGLRTLKGYQPWFKLPDYEAILDHLEADIICFQETKMTRKQATEVPPMCVMPRWHAFFDFAQKGYSGTVTYVRKDTCTPVAADIGITGHRSRTQKLPAFTPIGHVAEACADQYDSDLIERLNGEGRAVVVDCGMFVLFNLYCPNLTNDSRMEYKIAFNRSLEERAKNLIAAGREVIIVGDLNIARDTIDHADHVQSMKEHGITDFKNTPSRSWLDSFLVPQGPFHDVGRELHPTRQKMYTCWNTLLDTRPQNFGTRLDYTLVSPGLKQWVKGADIQPDVYGSDHCPVYIDLHDELTMPDGSVIHITDLMDSGTGASGRAPPLAAEYWPEFVHQKRGIKSFFAPAAPRSKSSQSLPHAEPSSSRASNVSSTASSPAPSLTQVSQAINLSGEATSSIQPPERSTTESPVGSNSGTSGKPTKGSTAAQIKSKMDKKGQTKINSFFTKPKASPDCQQPGQVELQGEPSGGANAAATLNVTATGATAPTVTPSAVSHTASESKAKNVAKVEAAQQWGAIFAKPPPPRCKVHNEPAKEWLVNKSGPNKGRKFWLCSRPVGPGYEKSGRDKSTVDRQYRCDWFAWDSDVRTKSVREARQAAQQSGATSPQASTSASGSTSTSMSRSIPPVIGTSPSLTDARSPSPSNLSFSEISRRDQLKRQAEKEQEESMPHKRVRKD